MLKIEKMVLLTTNRYILWRRQGKTLMQKAGTQKTSKHISDSALPENLLQGMNRGRGASCSSETVERGEKVLKEDLL